MDVLGVDLSVAVSISFSVNGLDHFLRILLFDHEVLLMKIAVNQTLPSNLEFVSSAVDEALPLLSEVTD